jgi:hypothetical protein
MSALAAARDIAIIVLAVLSLVIGVLLVILLLQLQGLIRLLQEEIRPILASAQETIGTVRGTTSIVSEYVVSPVAHVASILSGVRQTVGVFTGRRPRDDGS